MGELAVSSLPPFRVSLPRRRRRDGRSPKYRVQVRLAAPLSVGGLLIWALLSSFSRALLILAPLVFFRGSNRRIDSSSTLPLFFPALPNAALAPQEDDTATFGAAFEGLPTGKQRQEEEEVSGICVIHKTEKKPKGGNKARTTTTTKKKKKKKVAPEAAPSLVCKKTDGKGWQCKREAHHSHSLCEYHLIQVRSYYSNGDDQNPEKKSAETKKTTRRNVSGRRSPQTSDFYYYSGFGPWWGKRRSGADVEKAPPLDDQGGDEEEEMDGGGATVDDAGVDVAGNRRARKPIKARSLMSLL